MVLSQGISRINCEYPMSHIPTIVFTKGDAQRNTLGVMISDYCVAKTVMSWELMITA